MEFTFRLRSAIAPPAARGIKRAIVIILAGASLFVLMLAAGAIGSSGAGPTTDAEAVGAPFGTTYGNTISVQQLSGRGYFLGGNILGYGGSYIQHTLIE